MTTKCILPRLSHLVRQNNTFNTRFNVLNLQNRNITSQNSNTEDRNTKFEVTKSPEDWKYVERILAPLIVPIPKDKKEYVSGWQPQSDLAVKNKYFVPRTKNFMIPVYVNSSFRGMRKITKIQKVQGNVFELEKDLKKYLESATNKDVAIQVNELVGYVHIKGDFGNLVKDFLTQKGF